MSNQFELPPGVERATVKHDRLAFTETPGGTRRLVRIEQIVHREQQVDVEPRLKTGEVTLKQSYVGSGSRTLEDWVFIQMAPEEARRIGALLIAGADAVEDAVMRAADSGQP